MHRGKIFRLILMERIDGIYEKVKAVPEDPRWFGMIHGDFHSNNYFVDGNNIWIFDFDECNYGYFMYDIASACITWALPISRPSSVIYELRAMFWDLKGATDNPSSLNILQSPAARKLFPALDMVPCIMITRSYVPPRLFL